MKSVRKKLMNNEMPRECMICYKEEASGYRSKRQWENDEWSEKVDFDDVLAKVKDDGEAPFDIRYIDMKLGNKCDLESKRAVSKEQGEEFAQSLNIPFIEASAKDGKNVDEAFLQLARELMSKNRESEPPTRSSKGIKVGDGAHRKGGGCC